MTATKYNTPAKLAANKRWRDRNTSTRAAKHAAYVAANPDKIKHNNLRRIGWTLPLYTATLATQRHLCAICERDFLLISAKAVHADHDHVTGKPRGILCGKCNVGIAMFTDNPAKLKAAAAYLERYK